MRRRIAVGGRNRSRYSSGDDRRGSECGLRIAECGMRIELRVELGIEQVVGPPAIRNPRSAIRSRAPTPRERSRDGTARSAGNQVRRDGDAAELARYFSLDPLENQLA